MWIWMLSMRRSRRGQKQKESLDRALLVLQRRYGGGIIKTGDELRIITAFKM